MTPDITQELVIAYVRGTATPAEAEAVRTWLAQPVNQLLAGYWMQLHWDELAAGLPLATTADDPDFEVLLADLRPRLARSAPPRARTWRR